MKKKVLVCAYSCVSESGVKNIGGEAELGWNMPKQLSHFFDVYVLTHVHNKESIEALLVKEPLQNIHFFYIKLPDFLGFLESFHKGGIQIYSYLWQVKAYFVAKKLHKELGFDVFHHVTYANDWMASFIGALLPIPYVRGPGGGAHRVPKSFTSQYSFHEKLAEKMRSLGQWLFRHDPFFIMGQNKAGVLLVCNQESFDALPKKWQEKAQFFPVNGISEKDLQEFSGSGNTVFTFISAGKLIKLKGVSLAIQAFKLFCQQIPVSQLIIVGDGPELKNLQHLVVSLSLEKSVIFKTWMPRQQLLKEISTADVFLFPSLRDGGGAVVVEAMAQAKPVICFDMAGPGFHIHDEWGIKIKPTNPEQSIKDMAEAMENLYYNKEAMQQLGRLAKERAENFYLWDRLGEKLNNVYEHILKS